MMLAAETSAMVFESLSPETQAIVSRALSWAESRPFPRVAQTPSTRSHALLARWKKLVTSRSGEAERFDERLRSLGLSEDGALNLLDSPCIPASFEAPAWAVLLDEVLSMHEREDRVGEAVVLCEAAQSRIIKPAVRPLLLRFVAPFVAHAMSALEGHIGAFEPIARQDLAFALATTLSWIAGRTAAYELKKARVREGLLAQTSEKRYREFVDRILPASRRTLFQTYPVLARMMSTVTGQFIQNTCEIAQHLAQDLGDLSSLAEVPLRPRVATVSPFLSDVHNGGRSVCRLALRTEDGGLRTFFHKPRSVQTERAWRSFLAWTASRGLAPQLQSGAVLDRGVYGWCAEIAALDCTSEVELRAYFRRQGAQTALITVLGGQDFHGENFIASGSFPVAIDCEGLFAPIVTAPTGALAQLPLTLALMQYSGAGNLMLPYFRSGEPGEPMYSASAVAGTGVHPWPRKLPRWSGLGTDELSLVFDLQDLRFDESLPTRNGIKVCADDYISDIVEGIQSTWDFLHAHHDELADPAGPLSAFQGCSSRVLLRDTQQYADLMFWTTAPDILDSGAAYDVALEALAGATPFFCNGARFAEIVGIERNAFWQRDIPMAEAANDTTTVHFATGESFGPILERSPWVQTMERLTNLRETEAAWQGAVARSLLHSTRRNRGVAPASLLEAAVGIGDEVCDTALEFGDDVSWLTFMRAEGSDRVIPLQAQAWDLTGNAGNAIFLADLARVTGQERYSRLARQALRSARRTLDMLRSSDFAPVLTLSGFTGSFGLVYAMIAVGKTLRESALLDDALDLALSHPQELFAAETNPDWLTGAAGTLAVLACLYAVRPHDVLLRQAEALQAAIKQAERDGGIQGWQVPFFSRPLLGMAHGSSGVAAGLLAAEQMLGLPVGNTVLNAFTHERACFDRERMRWPNLQHEQTQFMTGWCAGPAGFGMARLLALRSGSHELLASRDALLQDLHDAVDATVTCAHAGDHHACCGDAGTILFLSMAAKQLHREDLAERAHIMSQTVLQSFVSKGVWRMQGGFNDHVLFPGLLSGQVGIGMAFLSVLDPRTTEYLALC